MRLTVHYFSLFIGLFYLFLNLQLLGATGWILNEESAVKFYHIFSLLFIPFLLLHSKGRIPKIPSYIFDYYVGITLISAVLFFFYPVNKLIINHLFTFYTFYIGYYVASLFTQEQLIIFLQRAAIAVFLIVVAKLFYHIPEIKRFMQAPDGHPAIYTIYGGGTNLEATWLGLNTALFINRKRLFYILLTTSLVISIIYASRVGVVIALLVAGFKFISAATTSSERRAIISLGVLAALAFVIFFDLDNIAQKVYALKRFADFGGSADKGMAGRFAMWQYYGTALWESRLLGYGAGNGMYAIESVSGNTYPEDNLHNLYMQLLIEFGLLGLFLYLITVYNISIKAIRSRLSNPFAILILVYFIASLVQFRGTDALVWLSIGMFLKIESNKETSYAHAD